MRRPPPSKIVSEIQCPQCSKPLPTSYECQHEGVVNIEVLVLKCPCGYEYISRGRHTAGA